MTNSPYTPPIYGPAQPQVYIPQQGYPYSPEIPPNQPPANIPPGQPFPQQPGMGQQPPMEYHEPYGGQPQQQQIIPPAQYMQNMPGNQFSSENVVPNDVYVVHAANPYPKADTAADLPHKKGKKDKIKKKRNRFVLLLHLSGRSFLQQGQAHEARRWRVPQKLRRKIHEMRRLHDK